MRKQHTFALMALLLLASTVSAHGSRYRRNRRMAHVPPEAVEASHEGDFDPTRAVMSRRLLRDPVVHGEEDAHEALRQLHQASGPRCRAQLRHGIRPAFGG